MAQLQEKIELLENKLHSDSSGSSFTTDIENTKLRQALIKLKEVSEQDLKIYKYKIIELEKENARLATYPDRLKESQENIDLLMEQLELAEKSGEIIEQLTNKNLELGETISDLEQQLKGLIEYKEYSEQLDAYNAEEISILKGEIGKYCRKSHALTLSSERKNEVIVKSENTDRMLRATLQEKERVINSFREKCAQVTKQLHSIQDSQNVEESVTEEMKNRTSTLMHTYHRLQTKLQRAKSQMWDHDLSEMEMRVLDK